MSGYYDYHPKVIPEQPIAIIGFPGARVALIGAAVSALTGLTLHELDRLIEHESGSTISLLVLNESESALRRLESKLLQRVLSSKPPGIITLGEGAMLDEDNRRRIKQQAKLIYIELAATELFAQLRKELAESPGKYFHLFPSSPEKTEDLQPFFAERLPFYREADLTINASNKHPTQVAQEIIDALSL